MTTLRLDEVREQAAAALVPLGPDNPDVHKDTVDAIHPPCLMLVWDEPWLEPRTFRGMNGAKGYWDARLTIRCIAGRNEPGPGIEKLKEFVTFVLGRMLQDTNQWPDSTLTAPRVFEVGNVPYLFADVEYVVPVTI